MIHSALIPAYGLGETAEVVERRIVFFLCLFFRYSPKICQSFTLFCLILMLFLFFLSFSNTDENIFVTIYDILETKSFWCQKQSSCASYSLAFAVICGHILKNLVKFDDLTLKISIWNLMETENFHWFFRDRKFIDINTIFYHNWIYFISISHENNKLSIYWKIINKDDKIIPRYSNAKFEWWFDKMMMKKKDALKKIVNDHIIKWNF